MYIIYVGDEDGDSYQANGRHICLIEMVRFLKTLTNTIAKYLLRHSTK